MRVLNLWVVKVNFNFRVDSRPPDIGSVSNVVDTGEELVEGQENGDVASQDQDAEEDDGDEVIGVRPLMVTQFDPGVS